MNAGITLFSENGYRKSIYDCRQKKNSKPISYNSIDMNDVFFVLMCLGILFFIIMVIYYHEDIIDCLKRPPRILLSKAHKEKLESIF